MTDLYQSIREQAYSLADARAKEFGMCAPDSQLASKPMSYADYLQMVGEVAERFERKQEAKPLNSLMRSLAASRAPALGVTADQYLDWAAGKPAPEVDQAMIRETDDVRRVQAVRR